MLGMHEGSISAKLGHTVSGMRGGSKLTDRQRAARTTRRMDRGFTGVAALILIGGAFWAGGLTPGLVAIGAVGALAMRRRWMR